MQETIKMPSATGAHIVPVMGTVRVGLIGLGSFMRSEILPHLKKCDGVKVVAIAHSHGLDSKKIGEEWGVHYVTSDYKKLIEDKNIDLIICATRHSSHAKIAVEVLKAGKHLHMEKPLALNEEELASVMEAARTSKGRLMVGFNRRFSEHLQLARKEFYSAKTPKMTLYRVNYALEAHWSHDPKEGGRLIGEACHFTDVLQFISGSKPRRILAAEVPVKGAVTHEENFSFTVEFDNGSVGTVFYSGLGNFQVPKEYIEIYADGKVMIIDNFQRATVASPSKVKKYNLSQQHKGYKEEFDEFLRAIRDGKPSPIPLDEIYLSHLAIFKVAEALKTGGVVNIVYS
jgi:polar amino acid transport system substrate-binding protein